MGLGFNIYARLACAVLLMSLTGINLAPALGLPSKKPLSKDWQLIAASNIIARAKIDAPLKIINKMQASKNSDYINLRVTIHELAKGEVEKTPLTVREYLGFDWFARRPSAMGKLIGKEVLVFLFYVDEPGSEGIYFAGQNLAAVRTFDKQVLQTVKREVMNQRQIVEHFQEFPIANADSSDKSVRALLSQLTVEKTHEEAWTNLLKLPNSSAAALIRAMDDERLMGHFEIEIPVPPGPHRFEEIAHYGPKTILDAVSILLEDKTTGSFGQISNGGSERERHTVLNAWKVWAYYNLPAGTNVMVKRGKDGNPK